MQLRLQSVPAGGKGDFIRKLKTADKEAIEAGYWLDLSKFSKTYPNPD